MPIFLTFCAKLSLFPKTMVCSQCLACNTLSLLKLSFMEHIPTIFIWNENPVCFASWIIFAMIVVQVAVYLDCRKAWCSTLRLFLDYNDSETFAATNQWPWRVVTCSSIYQLHLVTFQFEHPYELISFLYIKTSLRYHL